MAKIYRARPTASELKRPMAPDTVAHCDYVAESLQKAAKKSRALATEHEKMAKWLYEELMSAGSVERSAAPRASFTSPPVYYCFV